MVASFDALIQDLRFEEAAQLIDSMPAIEQAALRKRLEVSQLACEPAARRRSGAIQAAARNHDFEALVELASDPLTKRLLAVLPRELRDAGLLQLQNADSWEDRKTETTARRLEEAAEALAAFDIRLARSLVSNLDNRFLSDASREDRDRLLIDIEARAMEAEVLSEKARALDAELRPPASNQTSTLVEALDPEKGHRNRQMLGSQILAESLGLGIQP